MESHDTIAKKARATYLAIRQLRKDSPTKYKWQRDELEAKVKQLEEQWWDDVKGYFEWSS